MSWFSDVLSLNITNIVYINALWLGIVDTRPAEKVVIYNESVYRRWREIHEVKEYQPLCVKHKDFLFGKNILIYLDSRKKIYSLARTGSIPDGIMLTIEKGDVLKMWIVEFELENHLQSDHVVNQLDNFVAALQNQDTRNQLWERINDEIDKDTDASQRLDAIFGTKKPLRILTSLMSQKPGIVIVIDRLPPEKSLLELIGRIDNRTEIEPVVIEFTPFRNDKGEMTFLSDILESVQRQSSSADSISNLAIKSNSKLADVVRAIIKGYNRKVFDISQVNKDAASQLPDLVSELGAVVFYHRVRAIIFNLKAKNKLQKLDTKGHSGEYKQIASF